MNGTELTKNSEVDRHCRASWLYTLGSDLLCVEWDVKPCSLADLGQRCMSSLFPLYFLAAAETPLAADVFPAFYERQYGRSNLVLICRTDRLMQSRFSYKSVSSDLSKPIRLSASQSVRRMDSNCC